MTRRGTAATSDPPASAPASASRETLQSRLSANMALAHSVLRSRKRYGRDPLGRAVGAISHSTTTSLLATSSINLVWTLHRSGKRSLLNKRRHFKREVAWKDRDNTTRPRTENLRHSVPYRAFALAFLAAMSTSHFQDSPSTMQLRRGGCPRNCTSMKISCSQSWSRPGNGWQREICHKWISSIR